MEEKVKTFTEMLYDDEVLNEGSGEYGMLCEVKSKLKSMDAKLDAILKGIETLGGNVNLQ